MKNTLGVLLFAAISQVLFVQNIESAKILSVVFMSSKSHKIVYDPLLEALAARGHEITVLSPVVTKRNITNIRDVLTFDSEEDLDSLPNFFEMKEKSEDMNPIKISEIFNELCQRTYVLPQVKEILNEKFDLVIHQALLNECVAGYLHKLNTSTVLVLPFSVQSSILQFFGGPSPVSFVPNFVSGLGEKMNFWERFKNFLAEALYNSLHRFYLVPKAENLYRTVLDDLSIPGYAEIIANASLILSNSHFSISGRRPFMPDVVEVGGMHCRPGKPLPKDLEDFVQSSGKDGFIFFSMGSVIKGTKMPEKYRKIILSAFSKLKQKVLWKWETEIMDDLPANVKLIKWAPQQDILGHPKIRAFITHGGFGSSTEAVYHGVPLIGIPMFSDQELNIQKAVKSGYARKLELTELSENNIIEAIQTVIDDPKYKENVQMLSAVFRDQPTKPLDRAVYWTEYVLRHKGATHLRSAARDLNFFQYHSLDVIGTIAAFLLMALYILFAFLRFIVKKLCGLGKRSSKANQSTTASKKPKAKTN